MALGCRDLGYRSAMAPMAPLGREKAMQYVARGELPVWFGSPHPTMMILEQDGVFRIRALVVPPDPHHEGKTPEQHYGRGQPTGKIYVESPTREALLEQMRTMTWEKHW